MFSSYLIKHASIFSPGRKKSEPCDILVEKGVITKMERNLTDENTEFVLDAQGMLVTAGWVDVHTHLYGFECLGVDPQIYMLPYGVTYALDAGSAGADNFAHYQAAVRGSSDIQYKTFLNVSRVGMPLWATELLDMTNLDENAFIETYNTYRKELLGIKMRLSANVCSDPEKTLRAARKMADKLEVPLFVHAVRCTMSTEAILDYFVAGDTLTHTLSDTPSGIMDENGRIKPCVWKARERGIYFDMGHGAKNFYINIAKAAKEQGFEVDTISTDIHIYNAEGPVYDMPTTMSKYFALGASLDDVIRKVTVVPAEKYGLKDKSLEIKVGQRADLTAFTVEEGSFDFEDSGGNIFQSPRKIVSQFTAVGEKVFSPKTIKRPKITLERPY